MSLMSPPGVPAGAADKALQTALAAEQAAAYGYGVIGAHLAGAERAAAAADWIAHQVSRDQLAGLLRSRGADPAAAAVAYRLPVPVQTAGQAMALAVILEERVCAGYLSLVAISDRALRTLGAQQIRQSALRAAAWRGATVAFPGLPASALERRPAAVTRGPRARG